MGRLISLLKRYFDFSKPAWEEIGPPAVVDENLTRRQEFFAEQEKAETPWAVFEITDFSDDDQVKVEFNWNQAFIAKINGLGFQAETEEDSVQLFFYTAQMTPASLVGHDRMNLEHQLSETLEPQQDGTRIVT